MYLKLHHLLLSISLTAWALSQTCSAQVADSCNGDIVDERIDTVSINQRLPKRIFHTVIRDECYTVDIFEQGKPDTIQRIQGEIGSNFPSDGIRFEDANFDGFRDLLLIYNFAGFGEQFEFWLFNPRSGRFEYNDEFTQALDNDPSFDYKEQSIETGGNGGCMGMCFDYETYEVHEGKLLLVQRISQDLAVAPTDKSPAIFIRTLERLQSGKMKIIARVKGTMEEVEEKAKSW